MLKNLQIAAFDYSIFKLSLLAVAKYNFANIC